MSVRSVLHILLFSSIAYGCAIQVPPQGGDKDTTPPKLLGVTPADGSTGFHAGQIEFEFDENIQLKELSKKLVVSPPLANLPLAKVRKNRLIIPIEDTLLPSATYNFNFGDAICDLNEGNPITDFKYVFSTGTFIDSLSVTGSIIRAEDLKPEKSAFVMLYAADSDDSIPYQSPPIYFARANDKGKFIISNVAAGRYRIFGLVDANQDYQYGDPSERIAFGDTFVTASDTMVSLHSFLKKPLPAVAKASATSPGRIDFHFNVPEPAATVRWKEVQWDLQIRRVTQSSLHDTVTIWYSRQDAESVTLPVDFDNRTDTFALTLKTISSDKKSSVNRLSVTSLSTGISQCPAYPLTIRATIPVENIDMARILLSVDSLPVALSGSMVSDSNRLVFTIPVAWQEEKRYSLLLLPGAFTDIFGQTNDTVAEQLLVKATTDYGTLRLHLDLEESGTARLVQLVDEKENVFRTSVVNADTVLFHEYLLPGSYRIKIIDDANGNGRWDAGDDLAHRQPESVRYHRDQVPVRANWDVEVKWKVQR